MQQQDSNSKSSVWQLASTRATLQHDELAASIDLLRPERGISDLVYQGKSIGQSVLGIHPSHSTSFAEEEISDAFVRGNDLVVTYLATIDRPYSVQSYWRITASERGAVLLDTILSLQTDLLESFPDFATTTNLPPSHVLQLGEDTETPVEILLENHQPHKLPTENSDSLVLRPLNENWSYGESSHPEDRGECVLDRAEDGTILIERKLGGNFLEKGVIRRLRVRGVFLPRENDLDLAATCFESLSTQQPPLTT